MRLSIAFRAVQYRDSLALKALAFRLLMPLFCLLPTLFFGQALSDRQISIQSEKSSIEGILRQIESAQDIRFYYQKQDLPKRQFTLDLEATPLSIVLDSLLKDSPLGFMPYRSYAIILLPKSVIEQSFSPSFYRTLSESIADLEAGLGNNSRQLGTVGALSTTGIASIEGKITDAETGETIIGATLLLKSKESGTSSDADGQFTLQTAPGKDQLLVQSIGYADLELDLRILSDDTLNIELEKAAIDLNEVLVKAEAADANVNNVQIGVERLEVKTIKQLPAFLGEVDVIKSLLLQPGVSSVGDGAAGFNVRGGNVDQNLIIQDDAFLFNAAHALGFFSTFNSDLLSDVTLYKGNIPAQFGGRLASVLDVGLRDGNMESFQVKGGLGIVSSRLSIEGPIKKNKSSLLAGFRSTYSDGLLQLIDIPEVQRSSVFFYDANLKYTHQFNEKNRLSISGYSTQDRFIFDQQFGFEYSTWLGQIIYRKSFSDRLFSKLSATYSSYNNTQLNLEGADASELENRLSYLKVKEQITYTPDTELQVDAGISSIYYHINPGTIRPNTATSTLIPKTLEKEYGLESAAFINTQWSISSKVQIAAGLRAAFYQFLGPGSVFQYQEGLPLDISTIIDTIQYESGDIIANYSSLEPRFSARYRMTASSSLKFGYSRTAQFINQISDTNTPTPGSQWQLSTNHIAPTRAHNFSFGLFKNLKDNLWESSVEVYYRAIDDLFDYIDFAQLDVNEHLETELVSGIGRAYGLEFSLKKKAGNFNGFLNYTLSRSEAQVEGINLGNWFPSNFDKTNDISLVLNLKANERNSFTLNFNYATGRPTTAPISFYTELNGLVVPIYSERNQLRGPDFHRLDIAYTIGQGYKKSKKFKTSWTFSIYNVYGRRNAFSIFFTQRPFNPPTTNQLSILGSAFPAITFNFEVL